MIQTITSILFYFLTLVIVFTLLSIRCSGQDSTRQKKSFFLSGTDSLLATDDSAVYFSLYASHKKAIREEIDHLSSPISNKRSLGISSSLFPINLSGPFLNMKGGYAAYAMNYRSVIDTPYAEKNILQHNIMGKTNFIAGGWLPLQLTYLIRNSNSAIFGNIYDIQFSLDPAGLRSLLQDRFRKKLEALASSLDDSLTEKLLQLKSEDLNLTKKWLQDPFQSQRIIEANEVLKVRGITYKPAFSPQQNKQREDSLRIKAAKFLALYAKVDSLYGISFLKLDSLKSQYTSAKTKMRQYTDYNKRNLGSYSAYSDWRDQMQGMDLPDADLSKKYARLLAIRNFSVGRSPLNYSELTAKNISVKGINFEYNSWYYVAFSAGLVDARFRDFSLAANRNKQYLVMARIGYGNLDKNCIILSAFRGRKQLFTSNSISSGPTNIDINGYTLGTKWKIDRNSSVTGELAQSISPDFRNGDLTTKTKFNLSDRSNKAFSLKYSAYYPKSKSRIEGSYKYTGANYQSFSSFQTNSALTAWYLKGEQNLFGRMFKLSASVRTNDFSNPYIIQQYESNTVFKSVNLSFRKSKWPSLSVGYQPMSQLTMVDNYIVENRFQSLNANLYHYYTVGAIKTASTVMFNKFYNHSDDTSFIYFNASNIYFGQSIFLGAITASLAISDTRNSEYQTQVFDESLQMNIAKASTLLLGVKINNFNGVEVKVGAYVNTSLRIWKNDILYISYERGFLPGYNKGLIKNDMATIQFTKFFGSAKNY